MDKQNNQEPDTAQLIGKVDACQRLSTVKKEIVEDEMNIVQVKQEVDDKTETVTGEADEVEAAAEDVHSVIVKQEIVEDEMNIEDILQVKQEVDKDLTDADEINMHQNSILPDNAAHVPTNKMEIKTEPDEDGISQEHPSCNEPELEEESILPDNPAETHHKVKTEPGKDKSHKCASCNETFASITDVSAHVRSKHTDLYKLGEPYHKNDGVRRSQHRIRIVKPNKNIKTRYCQVCQKTLSSPKNLAEHIKAIHECEQPHACKVCSKSFSKRTHMIQHLQTSHGINKVHDCDVCDASFAANKSLWQHIKSIHQGHKYPCSICSKNFSHPSSLNKHLKTLHNVPQEEIKSARRTE